MPPTRPTRRRSAGVAFMLSVLVLPAAADAHQKGRAAAAARPQVASAHCDAGMPTAEGCSEGAILALRGERLADAARVDFLGAPGTQDDRHSHPRSRRSHRLLVRVPARAQSGLVRVVSHAGRASRGGPRLVVVVAEAAPAVPEQGQEAGDGVFPVRARPDYGTATNAFGGGRGHQGQDIFAACGTPVVAARAGRVVTASTAAAEGNYAVTEAPDGTQQAYLHMLRRAAVRKGDQVAAGEQIGKVGETGNAIGCHLHFELWTAPGRFTGGRAYDPRPDLDRWAGPE